MNAQRRAGLEVGAAQHLAQVPLALGLADHVGLGEFLCAVGEVAAEDHRVGPDVADHVGHRVGLQRGLVASPPGDSDVSAGKAT